MPNSAATPGLFRFAGQCRYTLPGQLLLLLALLLPVCARACPDLTPFYAGNQADWPALEQQLVVLMPECLQSAEYFALLGAAQLNSGTVGESMESLERALLLQPDHGAAQIDYARALFQQGQLFSALELNGRLLARDDLPADLQPMLQDRQQSWQALTRQKGLGVELSVGHDNNLNSAPGPSQITLTLGGEDVILELNPDFQPVAGPYLNYRFTGRYRQLAPEHQHNVLVDLRGRVSDNRESDLLQLDTRYAFVRPDSNHNWQLTAAMSHLFFGGDALYTATEAIATYQPRAGNYCRAFYNLALQHQLFHNQSRLNAVESKLAAGTRCPFNTRLGSQQLSLEVALLGNHAVKAGRPGGDRQGWQVNLDWQWQVLQGELHSQLSHTRFDDSDGYSVLLENNAKRRVERSYLLLQYRRPLSARAVVFMNLFHQYQGSNLELFQTSETSAEIGIGLSF